MVSYIDPVTEEDSQLYRHTVIRQDGPFLTRRTVLKAGAAAAAIGATGGGGGLTAAVLAQDSTPEASSSPVTIETNCVLTPELTEGPYFLDGDLIRKDITEGKPGVPLKVRILVADITSCQPLANAAVDIWHCDAHGYYSGVSANNPGPDSDPEVAAEAATQTFLRGIQITDENGLVEFDTIYPGWYIGRTIHIHMKVVVDGEAGATYEDGKAVHTGQLFFDDGVTDQVLLTEAYSGRPDEQRTVNDTDDILGDHEEEDGFMLTLTQVSDDAIEDGLIGEIAIGVDPTGEQTADAGMGGGPGAPPSDDQP